MNVSRETFHTCVFIPPLCNAGCWRRGGAISPREEEGGTFDGQEVLADTDDKNSGREKDYYYTYDNKIEKVVRWSTFQILKGTDIWYLKATVTKKKTHANLDDQTFTSAFAL